jgi:hypothetical protein
MTKHSTQRLVCDSALIGFAAPSLLVNSVVSLKPLKRGETMERAWKETGRRLQRAGERLNAGAGQIER